ncbi:MAG TPA: hypothetical protein VFL13_05820 [Candidatus Baltobacteraceae bacterium]|nr:hypothetical protein [Candidatus Baltobacteraceae bacterium]
MGAAVRFDDSILWRALAASLALHLMFALFLPIWTPPQSQGLQPIESVSFAHLMRVQIEHPSRAALPVAVPKHAKVASKVTLARTRAEISAKTHKQRSIRIALTGPSGTKTAAAPKENLKQNNVPLIAQAPASNQPQSVIKSETLRTPDPDASVDTRSVESSGASDRGGVMPLGENNPPTLDPGVRDKLAKLIQTHVTLIVVVGEDGRTKSMKFTPPLDASTEEAMRTLLADAAWDPAVCGGGVSCEGTATIKL